MHLDFSAQRLLAIVAHPDDAELLCAGTLARAKADGAAIGVCVLCQGDRGGTGRSRQQLAAVRHQEMQAAASVLGATLLWGGISDGHLLDGPEHRHVLIELVRQFRPTLILAHSNTDYHSDHRAASALAEAVSWYCTSPGHTSSSPVMDTPPALWWMDTIDMLGFEPGFFIDVSRYMAIKQEMLACHASQLRRAGDEGFSPLRQQMERQARARGAQAAVAAAEAFRIHTAWKRVRAW